MTQRTPGRPLTTILALLCCWTIGRVSFAFVEPPPNPVLRAQPLQIQQAQNRLARGPAQIASAFNVSANWFISSALAAAPTTAQPQRTVLITRQWQPPFVLQKPVYNPAPPRPYPVLTPASSAKPNLSAPSNAARIVATNSAMPNTPNTPLLTARPFTPSLKPNDNGNRISLSTWALWRPNGRSSADGGADRGALQLGGSQLGSRLNYRIASITPAGIPTATVNSYARYVMPIGQATNKEAALGISVRYGKSMPVEIAVERRAAITRGGRNAWGVIISSGINERPIGRALFVNGYAQAGVVGAVSRIKFIDGEASVMRALPSILPSVLPSRLPILKLGLGKARPQIGVTVAGSAQDGVSRLDIGPVITLRPVIGGATQRISVGWRMRAAGNAVPRTGLAISIGADF